MLAVTARLIHGTIRAGSSDDTAMSGITPRMEWPPSPARLFSALVAADGTGERCRVTDGSELIELERLEPPRIIADGESDVVTTILESRYVVRAGSAKGVVQNYPGRTAGLVHPGVVCAPRHPTVTYVWDEDVSTTTVAALATRAARIGYLGCADSPVEVTVTTNPPDESLPVWTAGSAGVDLPVPYPGFVEALDAGFEDWSSGVPAKRSWIPTRSVSYGIRGSVMVGDKPTVIWLALERAQPARRALALIEAFRAAVLRGCDGAATESSVSDGRSAPWVLHGHDIPSSVARPYQLARYLPLVDVGHRYSNGAVHGLAVWLPPATAPEVTETVRSAVFQNVRHLHATGIDVSVAPRRIEVGSWSTNPARWSGPASRWFSATPAVVQRARRGGPTEDDVRTWFADAGHPVPSRIRISAVPTRPGVAKLRPYEVHRVGRDRHPFVWLEVGFDEEVEGPLCVGRARSFGMGLLAPVTDQTRRSVREGRT